MQNLIDEMAQELMGTLGSAVKDLNIEDFDGPEYENVCYDFEITLDVAHEVFPQAVAKAKVAVEEMEAEMEVASPTARKCPRCTGPIPNHMPVPCLCIWCFYRIGQN